MIMITMHSTDHVLKAGDRETGKTSGSRTALSVLAQSKYLVGKKKSLEQMGCTIIP